MFQARLSLGCKVFGLEIFMDTSCGANAQDKVTQTLAMAINDHVTFSYLFKVLAGECIQ